MDILHFCNLEVKPHLIKRKRLKEYLFSIFKIEKKILESLNIIFCNDVYLLDLNQNFLNHNFYTDTLTFPLSTNPEKLIGEIYISVERIRENSKALSIPYQDELARVIIHGCLHLCGYKDKPKIHRNQMIKKQEEYLKLWYVSRET